MQKYKATGYLTLFDEEERQQRLSKIGNPLEKLSMVIDFEMFRDELEDAVLNKEIGTHYIELPLTSRRKSQKINGKDRLFVIDPCDDAVFSGSQSVSDD